MLNYLSITLCMIDIKWKTIMKPNNKTQTKPNINYKQKKKKYNTSLSTHYTLTKNIYKKNK